MNILIVGAGAIGCLVGGKLAAHGQTVTLAGRPRFAEAVQARGLIMQELSATETVHQVRAVASLAAAYAGADNAYDLAVLTVKSYDTAAALTELAAAAKTAGVALPSVVSLQNGVGNEETIGDVLGAQRVIAGTITTPVTVVETGVIRIDKPDHRIGLSSWVADSNQPLLIELTQALEASGFGVRCYPHAQGMKWTKLLMNMMANAACAILDEAPAVVFADPALVDMEIAAWREALAVMRQAGIRPVNLGKYPFRVLAPLIRLAPNGLLRPLLRSQVAGARGGKMPSLHIDLHSGKGRSEVDWLNGAVVRLGKQVGLATPVNRALTEIVLALTADPEMRVGWRGDHRRLVAASAY